MEVYSRALRLTSNVETGRGQASGPRGTFKETSQIFILPPRRLYLVTLHNNTLNCMTHREQARPKQLPASLLEEGRVPLRLGAQIAGTLDGHQGP